jgi:hypothetical protein
MHDMLERAASSAMERVLGRLWGVSKLVDTFYGFWKGAKDDTYGGRILEFADFLTVLAFIVQEGQGEGNGTIGIHVAGMPDYYAKFEGKEYDFLRPLVDEAGSILKEIMP